MGSKYVALIEPFLLRVCATLIVDQESSSVKFKVDSVINSV